MKLVLFSDLHLDASFRRSRLSGDAARRRREALRETLNRIVELAVNVKADALLCGGDLYEGERLLPETTRFLRATFDTAERLPVFIAPGNHDWYGPRSEYGRCSWPANVTVFKSSTLEPVTLTDGLTMWGAAHCVPAGTPNFLDDFSVDRGGLHLALFHGSEVSGLPQEGREKAPHAPFSAADIVRAGIHHAFLGHYHRPHDAERYTYPGNPDPLAFGERGDRGPVVISVQPDGRISRERHSVAVTESHDVEVDVSGCRSRRDILAAIETRAQAFSGMARFTLAGELADDIDLRFDDVATVTPNLDAATVRIGAVHTAYDSNAFVCESSVRGEFVRQVLQADIAEDERRRVLVTGLRALEGRDDLEVA